MPQRVQRENERSDEGYKVPQSHGVPHRAGAGRADDGLQVSPTEVGQGVVLEVVPECNEARDGDERVEDVAGDEGERSHEAEALLRVGPEDCHEWEDGLVADVSVEEDWCNGQQGCPDPQGTVSEAGPVRPQREGVRRALHTEEILFRVIDNGERARLFQLWTDVDIPILSMT